MDAARKPPPRRPIRIGDICGPGTGAESPRFRYGMSDPTLYIHVGPSKTATTFLQRDILGRIESAECLPVPEIEVEGRRLRFGDLFSLSPEFWRGL